MDDKGFFELIKQLRERRSELEDVEAKTATNHLPAKLGRTFSSFANRDGGGMIILGVSDSPHFEILGVKDIDEVQSQLANLTQNMLEPTPVIKINALPYQGKMVLIVEVSALPYQQRPCYLIKQGMHGGAYKRVGDQDQVMSPYEIFIYQSQATVPKEDIKSVAGIAHADILNNEDILAFCLRVKKISSSEYLRQSSNEALLEARHIIHQGTYSLMGLLCFDRYPQHYFPKLRITFLHYPENYQLQKQVRYIDNKVFEGSIPKMLEASVSHILSQLRQATVINADQLQHKSIPEIPSIALREACINAIVHRDYSPMALNREIQIRLFHDALIIESPGGLYGGVNIETLASHISVSRNAHLAALLEDLGIIENRGDGIVTIINSCKEHKIPPPRFTDSIRSFTVIFYRAYIEQQKSVNNYEYFFREHPNGFTRKDVTKALSMTVGEAKYFLKKMLSEGVIEKKGHGKGTRYFKKP